MALFRIMLNIYGSNGAKSMQRTVRFVWQAVPVTIFIIINRALIIDLSRVCQQRNPCVLRSKNYEGEITSTRSSRTRTWNLVCCQLSETESVQNNFSNRPWALNMNYPLNLNHTHMAWAASLHNVQGHIALRNEEPGLYVWHTAPCMWLQIACLLLWTLTRG